MYIIIKNGSKHFSPHYNSTLGKYYGDKREYLSDLKKRGLEPYDPKSVKKREVRKYKPSQWARDIVRAVESSGHVSGRVMEELHKAKVKKVPDALLDKVKQKSPKGGWF